MGEDAKFILIPELDTCNWYISLSTWIMSREFRFGYVVNEPDSLRERMRLNDHGET